MAKLLDESGKPIKCSESIYGSYYSSACSRNATVMREPPRYMGSTPQEPKPYCTIHDPARRAEKRKQREAKWDAQATYRERRRVELIQQIVDCGDLKEAETIFSEIFGWSMSRS